MKRAILLYIYSQDRPFLGSLAQQHYEENKKFSKIVCRAVLSNISAYEERLRFVLISISA